ncbi:alpha/beta hydrolase [Bauldia sp.]|uniref:alpha/beta hydrolase n=1 Tax=Bauldia sp. TaxID=2575872 RepID=UPI003BAA6B5F
MSDPGDRHKGQPILRAGAELETADAAVIMLHGRGASASDILSLSDAFDRPDLAYLAPQAAGNSWYPERFLVSIEENEPDRTSALRLIADLIGHLITHDITPDRTVLLGFSQGACLALEFAARHPDRYGAVIALSGGLMGETIDTGDYTGSLEATPVFLGSSDVDPHIPVDRVAASAAVMDALHGAVIEQIYPGLGHTVNNDEIVHIKRFLADMAPLSSG